MSYQIRWGAGGTVWEFAGAVTGEEIERANSEFFNDGRSDQSRYQILDARRVTTLDWSEREIKITAGYDLGATSTLKQMKIAWVATDPDVWAKIERYAEISRKLNSSWQFEGFADLESARAWVLV